MHIFSKARLQLSLKLHPFWVTLYLCLTSERFLVTLQFDNLSFQFSWKWDQFRVIQILSDEFIVSTGDLLVFIEESYHFIMVSIQMCIYLFIKGTPNVSTCTGGQLNLRRVHQNYQLGSTNLPPESPTKVLLDTTIPSDKSMVKSPV